MLDKLQTLSQLLRQLQQVPYVASKNLYRVAHYFLSLDEQRLQQFCTTLTEVQHQLVKCANCYLWQEREGNCLFCQCAKRDQTIICVVEMWYDVFAIERTGSYQGVYHVLGGALSPLDGIGPDELSLQALVTRVQQGVCKELILAMNQTPEGEATAAFISHQLRDTTLTISCLARGIPVGSSLEAMDRLTIAKALTERRIF
jgi:recombination protein RecR